MKKEKKKLSVLFKISSVIFLLCALLLLLARADGRIAEALNGTVGQGFRRAMAALGELLPGSVFELLLLLIPPAIILLVILLVRAVKHGGLLRLSCNSLAVVMLLWSGNALALGIGYNALSVGERMEIEPVDINSDSLAYTLEILVSDVNALADRVCRDGDGVAYMDCDLDELSYRICESYDALSDRYGFYAGFSSSARGVSALHLMSRLGLTGIYTYYTGQANVNTDYPDYDIAFTAAHELSHQRGIMPENQANFMAYLLCSTSTDPFLNYAAALNMTEYVGSALYRTDPDRYYSIIAELPDSARADLSASQAVYGEYGGGILNEISSAVNDLFLKSNGTPGTVSYGMVTELAVSYICSER